jgi:hypothetical protein
MRSIVSPFRLTVALCFGAFAVAGAVVNTHTLDARPALENLPLVGSAGGTSFSRECPDNHVLTGIRYRRGLALDGVGIRCRPVRSDGTLGSEISSGSMAGGNGGTAGSVSCTGNSVIVKQTGASQAGVGIGILLLGCYEWFPASKSWGGSQLMHLSVKTGGALPALASSTCSAGTEPATGIRGKHGSIIDSFGLHCSVP